NMKPMYSHSLVGRRINSAKPIQLDHGKLDGTPSLTGGALFTKKKHLTMEVLKSKNLILL
ncbi:hypothetical protein AB4262_15585, partial [Vibrio breoganii]